MMKNQIIIKPLLKLTFVLLVLITACNQNTNTKNSDEIDGYKLSESEIPRLSLSDQLDKITLQLESESTEMKDNQETESLKQRVEAIKDAKEASEFGEKSCEEIIDEYEDAIRKYMRGEGDQQNYNRFKDDPFFVDCRNQNKAYRKRISDLRSELRAFIRNQ